MKWEPVEYDPEGFVILSNGCCRADYFVKRAALQFINYGEPELFRWAVEQGMPEVMESAEACELILRMSYGTWRKKGDKPGPRKKKSEGMQAAFKAVWWYIGQDYPVHKSEESSATTMTACELAARDTGYRVRYVYEIWQAYGGHHPEGVNSIAAQICKAKGRQALQSK